jgi:hypothetical protein
MDSNSYYEIVIGKDKQSQPVNSVISSFELHLTKEIDLTNYSENIKAETLKITAHNWKIENPQVRKINFFLFLLQHANKIFKIKSQTKVAANIISTQLEVPYDKDTITTTYKRLSKVEKIIFPEQSA